jgi:hypothetical protein
MKATRTFVRRLCQEARLRIDKDVATLIVEQFGSEPSPHTYTEQDLWEQIRKLVMRYNSQHEHVAADEGISHPNKPKGGSLQEPDQQAF